MLSKKKSQGQQPAVILCCAVGSNSHNDATLFVAWPIQQI